MLNAGEVQRLEVREMLHAGRKDAEGRNVGGIIARRGAEAPRAERQVWLFLAEVQRRGGFQ